MNPAETLRVVIVDDEPLARERARRLLDKAGHVQIVGEAAGGAEGLKLIEALAPDVVLLDIQMPGLDGLRMLEALDDPPAVIFATAFEHHAVKAFELEAVDYLLKPFSAERLARALDRVRRGAAEPQAPEAHQSEKKISLQDGLTTVFVSPQDLLLCEIVESVVFAVHSDGERFIYIGTLSDIESALPPDLFTRINRQQLVNVEAIEAMTPMEDGGIRLRLRGGLKTEASRRRAHHLRARVSSR